jgi:integrase
MKSKNYPNIYKKAGQPDWVFSKYSAARGGEFRVSTGYEATDANAGAAYKEGMKRFNEWLGSAALRTGRDPLIRDIGKIVLASKKAKAKDTEIKARSEINKHIIPAFGHLRPSQVTALRLQEYENEERAKGRTSLYNTRKYLFEILRMAMSEGLIRSLPKWKPSDPDAEAPKFIKGAEFRQICNLVEGPEKLILSILYYQGARPKEVCQYRWEMINWRTGEISIPKAITKTRRARTIPMNSRVLKMLKPLRSATGPIFPGGRGRPDLSRVVYDRGWLAAMETLKLDFIVYNLRDSFCSRKINEGYGTTYIAQYVDSSVQEIEKRYAVSAPDIMKKMAG